jgi:hypothetical protein
MSLMCSAILAAGVVDRYRSEIMPRCPGTARLRPASRSSARTRWATSSRVSRSGRPPVKRWSAAL